MFSILLTIWNRNRFFSGIKSLFITSYGPKYPNTYESPCSVFEVEFNLCFFYTDNDVLQVFILFEVQTN